MPTKKRPTRSPRSYHVDNAVANELDDYAIDNEMSSSAVIRIAMKNELARIKRERKK